MNGGRIPIKGDRQIPGRQRKGSCKAGLKVISDEGRVHCIADVGLE